MYRRGTMRSFWLFVAVPCVCRGFLPPTPTTMQRRRIAHTVGLYYYPPPQSIHYRIISTILTAAAFVQKDFDLDSFAQELDASLQIAREALEDAKTDFGSDDFPTIMLLREMDDAMAFANKVVEDLQQEQEEYKQQLEQEASEGIDADAILGDSSNQVVEYLSKGFMNADSFQDFCNERTASALLLKESTVEQARLIALAKEQEANRLKQEIRSTGAKLAKAEATTKAVTIGLDGCLLGCSIGLFLWAAIPDYLGDNVHPSIPAFFGGGTVACASIVAWTSDTIASLLMEKVNFGCISRAILSILGIVLRFLVSIPGGIAEKVAEQQNELEDEMEEYRKRRRRR